MHTVWIAVATAFIGEIVGFFFGSFLRARQNKKDKAEDEEDAYQMPLMINGTDRLIIKATMRQGDGTITSFKLQDTTLAAVQLWGRAQGARVFQVFPPEGTRIPDYASIEIWYVATGEGTDARVY